MARLLAQRRSPLRRLESVGVLERFGSGVKSSGGVPRVVLVEKQALRGAGRGWSGFPEDALLGTGLSGCPSRWGQLGHDQSFLGYVVHLVASRRVPLEGAPSCLEAFFVTAGNVTGEGRIEHKGRLETTLQPGRRDLRLQMAREGAGG